MNLMAMIRNLFRRKSDEPYMLPSELVSEVGWCQNVLRTFDENGNVTAYCAGAAIDKWSRHRATKAAYPNNAAVLMKKETRDAAECGILAFWNDDPARKKTDVVRALRKAEDKFLDEWGED